MSDENVIDLANLDLAALVVGKDPRPQAAEAPVPAKPAKRSPSSEPLSARQLMRQLRARLRVVEREIKIRRDLETERAQIKRLLEAAKQQDTRIRAIRSAG